MRDFRDLDGFLAFVRVLPAACVVAGHEGVRRGAEIIQTEAKAEIGTYQGDAGPFAAWVELAQETKAERLHLGFSENDPELRTGLLRDNIEMSAFENEAAVGVPSREVGDGTRRNPIRDIGIVAEAQELGLGIPPRSFLGGAAFRKRDWVVNAIAGAVTHALAGSPPLNRPPGVDPIND